MQAPALTEEYCSINIAQTLSVEAGRVKK